MKTDSKKYYRDLPRKRMSSEVVFLDESDDVLLVKPTYREHWQVPGGVIELNESPGKAAEREVKEEIGLKIHNPRLLVVDYSIPSGPKDESIMFVYFGGILKGDTITKIKLQADELSEFKFVPIGQAIKMSVNTKFHTSFPERLELAHKAAVRHETYYLEDGKIII